MRPAPDQLSLPMGRRRRVLSYGGGTDSFAMLLRALQLGIRPDAVAFADVGDPEHEHPAEWPGTYRHIDEYLRPLLEREGIPFDVIDADRYPVRDARSLFEWMKVRGQIPVAGPNRICTIIAKVERFERWVVERWPGEEVETWIGFEAGEESRAANDPNAGKDQNGLMHHSKLGWGFWRKENKKRGVPAHFEQWFKRSNWFPMIEWGLCRCRSEELILAAGYPVPRKSACVFCPYATTGDFQTLARELPETFAEVVELEAVKPPTSNGAKLSIKNFRTVKHADGSKTYKATMLPKLVQGVYRPRPVLCTVCGRPKAQKATGCSYAAVPT